MKYKCAYCGSDSTSFNKIDKEIGTVTCKNCGQSFEVRIPQTGRSRSLHSDIYHSRALYYIGFIVFTGIYILHMLPQDNTFKTSIVGFFTDLIVGDGLSTGRIFFSLFFFLLLIVIPVHKFKGNLK